MRSLAGDEFFGNFVQRKFPSVPLLTWHGTGFLASRASHRKKQELFLLIKNLQVMSPPPLFNRIILCKCGKSQSFKVVSCHCSYSKVTFSN